MKEIEKLRIDKYLWAIRVFKTRSAAASACTDNKVKFNTNSVKPSKTVNIGEQYHIRGADRNWVIEVTGLLQNRRAFSDAINYYLDLTPDEEKQSNKSVASSFNTGKRPSKIGRPTKRDRRDLDDLLGL